MEATRTGPHTEAGDYISTHTRVRSDLDRRAGDIDTSIYGMPAFVTFTVPDLGRSVRWYTNGLGFIVLAELPGANGMAGLVHLRRHRYQDILLLLARAGKHGELGQWLPGRGMRYTIGAGGEDLTGRADRAARACAAEGGTIDGPARTAWNTVDLVCTDPDGYEVVLTSPVTGKQVDEQFSATVLKSVGV